MSRRAREAPSEAARGATVATVDGGLAPYEDVRVLSSTPSFRLLSALESRAGRRVVLVVPARSSSATDAAGAPAAHTTAARNALERLALAHASIVHPAVPPARRVVEHGALVAVELACGARSDGVEVVRRLLARHERIPYAAADAFVLRLREALDAARAAPSGPWFLGRIAPSNVLFDAEGRAFLVGFGANVVTDDAEGRPEPSVPLHQAPERIAGAHPSAMGDYVALLLLARSLLAVVELPPVLSELAHGTLARGALARALAFTEARVLGLPGLRVGLSEALALAAKVRSLVGAGLDPDALATRVAALLAATDDDALAAASSLTGNDDAPLVLAHDASFLVSARAGRRRLGAAQRRIVLELAARHALGVEAPATSDELFALAWPSERAEPRELAMNRLHAAVSRLRRLGLGDALERFDDGYRIAPSARVHRLLGPTR